MHKWKGKTRFIKTNIKDTNIDDEYLLYNSIVDNYEEEHLAYDLSRAFALYN